MPGIPRRAHPESETERRKGESGGDRNGIEIGRTDHIEESSADQTDRTEQKVGEQRNAFRAAETAQHFIHEEEECEDENHCEEQHSNVIGEVEAGEGTEGQES